MGESDTTTRMSALAVAARAAGAFIVVNAVAFFTLVVLLVVFVREQLPRVALSDVTDVDALSEAFAGFEFGLGLLTSALLVLVGTLFATMVAHWLYAKMTNTPYGPLVAIGTPITFVLLTLLTGVTGMLAPAVTQALADISITHSKA